MWMPWRSTLRRRTWVNSSRQWRSDSGASRGTTRFSLPARNPAAVPRWWRLRVLRWARTTQLRWPRMSYFDRASTRPSCQRLGAQLPLAYGPARTSIAFGSQALSGNRNCNRHYRNWACSTVDPQHSSQWISGF